METVVKEETVNISYSKAQAFRTCKHKFNLAHVVKHKDGNKPGLMPKEKGKALARGTLGHEILARYLNNIKANLEFPYAPDKCKEYIAEAVAWGIRENASLAVEVSKQCMHWGINVFPTSGWRILEVEKEYRIPVGYDSATGLKKVVPMTIDLVAEENGTIIVVDHKFSADAYSDMRIAIEPQIPIYIGVLRAMRIPAKRGYYNFMRTRKMNNVEDQVVRKACNPNDIRIKRSFQEHLETAKDIIVFQSQNLLPVRNANNNCDYCDFARPCATALRGDDISLMLDVDFAPNDYGYEE